MLKDNGMHIKKSKCNFFSRKVEYLGHFISRVVVETDPRKISVVVNWPIAKTDTDLG